MSFTPSLEERRIFDRFLARFPAKLKDSREDYGSVYYLVDASAHGMKIISRERLYLHDHISLEIKVPDYDVPLKLNGEVVWSRNIEPDLWKVGLRFPQVRLFSMSRLYKFVE